MPTDQEFQQLKREFEDLKKRVGMLTNPIDPVSKGVLENTFFNILQAIIFKGGLPVYTTARDTTGDKPKHGEVWLEDVSGPTRRICAYIVAPTTGVGTKYSVAIT